MLKPPEQAVEPPSFFCFITCLCLPGASFCWSGFQGSAICMAAAFGTQAMKACQLPPQSSEQRRLGAPPGWFFPFFPQAVMLLGGGICACFFCGASSSSSRAIEAEKVDVDATSDGIS